MTFLHCDAAQPYDKYLQDSVNSNYNSILDLHDTILFSIILILPLLVVFWLNFNSIVEGFSAIFVISGYIIKTIYYNLFNQETILISLALFLVSILAIWYYLGIYILLGGFVWLMKLLLTFIYNELDLNLLYLEQNYFDLGEVTNKLNFNFYEDLVHFSDADKTFDLKTTTSTKNPGVVRVPADYVCPLFEDTQLRVWLENGQILIRNDNTMIGFHYLSKKMDFACSVPTSDFLHDPVNCFITSHYNSLTKFDGISYLAFIESYLLNSADFFKSVLPHNSNLRLIETNHNGIALDRAAIDPFVPKQINRSFPTSGFNLTTNLGIFECNATTITMKFYYLKNVPTGTGGFKVSLIDFINDPLRTVHWGIHSSLRVQESLVTVQHLPEFIAPYLNLLADNVNKLVTLSEPLATPSSSNVDSNLTTSGNTLQAPTTTGSELILEDLFGESFLESAPQATPTSESEPNFADYFNF